MTLGAIFRQHVAALHVRGFHARGAGAFDRAAIGPADVIPEAGIAGLLTLADDSQQDDDTPGLPWQDVTNAVRAIVMDPDLGIRLVLAIEIKFGWQGADICPTTPAPIGRQRNALLL